MERTIKVIIEGPVQSYSFFGDKSREIIKAIKTLHDDWEIGVYNYDETYTRGGFHDEIVDSLIIPCQNDIPDIWIQIGHPARFTRVAKVNIGITIPYIHQSINNFVNFIKGCNSMDVILTYSEYSKNNILNRDVKSPVVVLPEYSAISTLKEVTDNNILKNVDTEWNFLCEGLFESTDTNTFGGKNKDNITFIVRTFLESFADSDQTPGLILNVHGDMASILDKSRLEKVINKIRDDIKYRHSLPPIYLISGDLSLQQRYRLYNDSKVKAMISVPQYSNSVQRELDFCLTTKKPIIYSNFAAQKEHLFFSGNIGTGGHIKDLNGFPASIIDTYTSDLKLSMYDMYIRYNKQLEQSQESIKNIINNYTVENFLKKLDDILQKYDFAPDVN